MRSTHRPPRTPVEGGRTGTAIPDESAWADALRTHFEIQPPRSGARDRERE